MTTITPFAAGSYISNRNASQLLSLKSQLNDLSNQLSSGQVSQTYGGLGSGRTTALAAQATISSLIGYASGIAAGQTRTKLAVTSLTQGANLGTTAKSTLDKGAQSTTLNTTAAQSVASANLQSALDTLNQSVAGNYLFGGTNTTTQPVVDGSTILNGTTNSDGTKKAGLTQLVADQVKADVGPGGTGHLTSRATGTAVTLSEDSRSAIRGTFGFTLSAAPTSTGSAIGISYTAGTTGQAGSATVTMKSQPAVGDSIPFPLKMPGGTTTSVTLTASASNTTASANSFPIGADAAATAANLQTAVNMVLTGTASTTLTVNATARAATNFFTGSASAGIVPQRVDFDASGDPTGYVAETTQNTVVWYQGEDSGTDPRSTQSVQVSPSSGIGVGARANEPAIQKMLAGLATVALAMPKPSSANSNAAYQAIATQAGKLLSAASQSPSVQDIVTQLSIGATQLQNASTSNTTMQNTLQSVLAGVEQAPTEEVAVKLMGLQNRIQASYQPTSTLSKLSLVSYIS